jgi:hypothetical protein
MSLRPFVHAIPIAIVLGLVAEVLFDGPALGLGVLVFVALLLVAGLLVRPAGGHLDRADLWLVPGALVFAGFIALRADPTLILFDLVAALGLATGAAVALSGMAVTRTAVETVLRLGGWAVAIVLVGTAHLLDRARPWVHVPAPDSASLKTGGTLARGLLLASVPVALFVALFAAADAVFARALADVTSISVDVGDGPSRVAFVLSGAWLAGGFLAIIVFGTDATTARGRSLLPWASVFFGSSAAPGIPATGQVAAKDPAGTAHPADPQPTGWRLPADARRSTVSLRPRLGWAEATVVLVAIELVFAAFVVIQIAYLFGGRDTLAASGQTYSQYATHGFDELVKVAVLAGAVILALEATIERRTRIYVAAAVGLLALTAVVLASAFLRLRLYQDAYGWTELRFYVFGAIVYLGLAIVAVGTLLIRDRSHWSIHALAIGALAGAVAVNLVGPHAFVAGQNVARAVDPSLVPPGGKSGLDAHYVLGLSDDAVPTLVAALPRIPQPDRSLIEEGLRQRAAALAADPVLQSPSAWNLARTQARDALDALPPQ